MKVKTTKDFEVDGYKRHGVDRYDYRFVDYKNSKTKVKIICNTCGNIFWQTRNNHIGHGHGCPDCAGNKKLNNDSFSKRANNIHDYKYDYKFVNYINIWEKVQIICPDHGLFEQVPHDHLQGKGCQACGKVLRVDTKTFKERAIHIHGDTYDYKDVVYVNMKTLIRIKCSKHGDFEQLPEVHLNGSGCPDCGRIQTGLSKRLDTDQFIEKANLVHYGVYNYDLVVYILSNLPVKIICNYHGVFEQMPNNHLSGKGCPICNLSKGVIIITKYLDDLGIIYCLEKEFEDCYGDSRPLKFDIYLLEYDILIEYDGEQHYEHVPYFHGEDDYKFEKQKRYDEIKNQYCIDKDIPLIRIRYDVEHIGDYLLSQLDFNNVEIKRY